MMLKSPSGRSSAPTRNSLIHLKQIYVDRVHFKDISMQQIDLPDMPVFYKRPLGEEVSS